MNQNIILNKILLLSDLPDVNLAVSQANTILKADMFVAHGLNDYVELRVNKLTTSEIRVECSFQFYSDNEISSGLLLFCKGLLCGLLVHLHPLQNTVV